jgi:phage baseplate assembly protein W
MPSIVPERIYKDLDLNFLLHSDTHDVTKKIDVNSVKQSIETLVLTRFGERAFAPDVGSPVYGLLFEPIDDLTTELIKQSIIQTVTNDEPRCILNDVDVEANPEQNEYDITISYTVVGIPLPVTFTFTLQRLR